MKDLSPQYFLERTELQIPNFAKAGFFNTQYVWQLLENMESQLKKESKGWRLDRAVEGEVDPAARLTGKVLVGEGTQILADTKIDGTKTPVVIGRDCVVGPNAYIRDGALIGNDCEIGFGAEIKNSLLLGCVRMHHRGYLGDSIVGEHVNIGANFDSANLRLDEGNIKIRHLGKELDTGLRKFGCVLGDAVKIGIKASTMPGTLIGPDSVLGAHEMARGFYPKNSRIWTEYAAGMTVA